MTYRAEPEDHGTAWQLVRVTSPRAVEVMADNLNRDDAELMAAALVRHTGGKCEHCERLEAQLAAIEPQRRLWEVRWLRVTTFAVLSAAARWSMPPMTRWAPGRCVPPATSG